MSDFLKDLKGNFIFLMGKAIDKKVDGREVGKNLDKEMDKALGKGSEKLQRGPITNLLFEILEGLWQESPEALKQYVKERFK